MPPSRGRSPKAKGPPLWRGPEEDGITFSLLSRFLVCRERFRLYTIEGLKPVPQFDRATGFGNLWHVCEEALAGHRAAPQAHAGNPEVWLPALVNYARGLCGRHRTQQEDIDHWYRVVRAVFPLYVKHWRSHPDVVARGPLLQEQVFSVPIRLPSGRVVKLRGKWDSVDAVLAGPNKGVWLQENKTKGNPYGPKIERQLTFDLQTMLYLVALQEEWARGRPWSHEHPDLALKGVRYNVVRRPLSGGKGSIVRKKPSKANPAGEGRDEFYGRLAGIVSESPGDFFTRWDVLVMLEDVGRFRDRCLDPLLENLCCWWDQQVYRLERPTSALPVDLPYGPPPLNYRMPYGVWNPLLEGGGTDYDEYLDTGNRAGLATVDTLFGELE